MADHMRSRSLKSPLSEKSASAGLFFTDSGVSPFGIIQRWSPVFRSIAVSMSVSKRPVTVGKITGNQIVVTEGLEGGEAIAMSGVHLLTEGRVVTEMEKSDETRQ